MKTESATVIMTPDSAEAVGAMLIAAAYIARSMPEPKPEDKKPDA